jgi:hypothetical protein
MNKGILFLLICLVLLPSAVYAHSMLLELEEPGVLRAEYDGGGFSPRTEVTIYDENGEELGKGLVDEEGKFHFDKSLDVHSAVAEDGMGHRAEYKKGVKTKTIPKLPVVIGVFAVVGAIFIFQNKKVEQK